MIEVFPGMFAGALPHPFRPEEAVHLFKVPRGPVSVPNRATQKAHLSKVENQGNQGSCTGHAASSAVERLARRLGISVELSRAFVYYYARKDGGLDVNKDSGAYINVACDVALNRGVALESSMPYNQNVFNAAPSAAADAEARNHKYVLRHAPISMDANAPMALQVAFAEFWPVQVGFYVYENMYDAFNNGTGIVPATPRGRLLGAHVVDGWGYQLHSDAAKFPGGGYAIIRNSWGGTVRPTADAETEHGDLLIPMRAFQPGGIGMELRVIYAREVQPQPEPEPGPGPQPGPTEEYLLRRDVLAKAKTIQDAARDIQLMQPINK